MFTVSAFFWKGPPRTIYDLVRSKKITMLLSSDMENEFIRVLGYSKSGVSPKEILPFINSLRSNAEFIKTHRDISVITVDPADNIFLNVQSMVMQIIFSLGINICLI
jgi:predicted nucleic acid-binding protein